jgi:hypothetical protein
MKIAEQNPPKTIKKEGVKGAWLRKNNVDG